jgi:hypothetical protein
MPASLHELTAGVPAAELNGHGKRGPGLRMRDRATPGGVLIWAAAILLLALAAAQGWVSWRAQYGFIFAAKHDHMASALEALGLDTGAVIFALLGLAHARMGRPARIERALNIACAMGSMVMNLLSAELGSPRSVAVYVLPAVLYAACSDRLIATAGHAAGVREASLWRWLGVGGLYGLRAVVAFPSTALGLRRKLLAATPLPASTATPDPTPAATEPPSPGPAGVPTQSRHRPRQPATGKTAKNLQRAARIVATNPDITAPGLAARLSVSVRTAERYKAQIASRSVEPLMASVK